MYIGMQDPLGALRIRKDRLMSEEPEDIDVLVNYLGIIVTEYGSVQEEDPEQFIKVHNYVCGPVSEGGIIINFLYFN